MDKKKEIEENLNLAGAVFKYKHMFTLVLKSKQGEQVWGTIEKEMHVPGASKKWSKIMKSFRNGDMREDDQLFIEIKKIINAFPIKKDADNNESSNSTDNTESESEKAVIPTKPGPSAAKSKSTTADLDEQNKKESREKIDELTKLEHEISAMGADLSKLTDRYESIKHDTEQLANKLYEL